MSEIEIRRLLGELSRTHGERAGHGVLPGRGPLQPLRLGDRRPDALPRRVADGLHALPAGGLAGHAPVDLRVPDAHLPADGARRRQRLALRGGLGARRGAAHGRPARARAATRRALGRHPPGVPRDGADLLREPRPGGRRGPARARTGRRTRPRSRRPWTTRRSPWRCSRPISTASSRTGRSAARGAAAQGAQSVAVVAEAASLALLAPPGEAGVDIACGEAQSLGVPMHNGGPLLGFLACRTAHQRQIPGRLVGETRDAEGRRAFCLTLSTREQHIRREKATSNICTNQGLMALASNIHMSLLGKRGLREVAAQSHAKAEYLKGRIARAPGYRIPYSGPTFNEFVGRGAVAGRAAARRASPARGSSRGVPLSRYEPERPNRFLVAVTEMNTREEMDRLVAELGSGLVSVEVDEQGGAGRHSGPARTPSPATSRSSSSGRARARSATRCRRWTCPEILAIPGALRRGRHRGRDGGHGGRDRAPLHAALAPEFLDRRGALPARLLHDEAQPAHERGSGATARVRGLASARARGGLRRARSSSRGGSSRS